MFILVSPENMFNLYCKCMNLAVIGALTEFLLWWNCPCGFFCATIHGNSYGFVSPWMRISKWGMFSRQLVVQLEREDRAWSHPSRAVSWEDNSQYALLGRDCQEKRAGNWGVNLTWITPIFYCMRGGKLCFFMIYSQIKLIMPWMKLTIFPFHQLTPSYCP